MKNLFYLYVLFPLMMIILELGSHFALFGFSAGSFILSKIIIAISVGSLIALIGSFLKEKVQKRLLAIILFFIAVLFGFVMIYYTIFQSFFMWKTIGLAGDATHFWREALTGMKNGWYMIVIAFTPFIIYLLLFAKYRYTADLRNRIILSGIIVLTAGFSIYNIYKTDLKLFRNFQNSPSNYYYQYGIIASSGTDIYQISTNYKAGSDSEIIIDPSLLGKTDITMRESKVILKNILKMDEQAMIAAAPNNTIADMHRYFLSRPASNQNDYTGIFEGKNIIFLTLEGFSDKCISKELTPTLYMMANEGFQFTNFYDTVWGGSTATGEYTNMTGNFYYSASCLPDSGRTFTYSALGTIFRNDGYSTYAYHNGYYNYYDRNISHPNFGYDVYKGVNGGLILPLYSWPNSDHLMAVATVDEYINSPKPFHAYYMTISGHTYYTYIGNNMAEKHRAEVEGLNYSEEVEAYIGTEIEVENMLKYLIERLEQAGKLDDTVFAMCCDHYPYGLSDESCAELYGLPLSDIRGNFELYRNSFILWSSSMEETVIVDKPCSSIDIVPTLANLFGLDYDSRFIMGTDILSDSENIAIINTSTNTGGMWNWKTAQGTYYTYTGEFRKSDTCTLADDQIDFYVKTINRTLDDMKRYSYDILDENYYSYVFNKDGTPKYPLNE
ncbi:MAG: sulfatase-like hydrolase/transferase [Erysipelotrichaceae bacterium]|nr:sulfatase-like hydrolase/transferase [Erysipelotrichaceae bacterium]